MTKTQFFNKVSKELSDLLPNEYLRTKECCTYALVSVEDFRSYRLPDQVCHSALRSMLEGHGYTHILLHPYNLRDRKMPKECAKYGKVPPFIRKKHFTIFYDWMINDSPWSQCFQKNSGEYAYSKYAIINGNNPDNLVLGAATLSRYTIERLVRTYIISELIERGVDGTIAFIVSQCFTRAFQFTDGKYLIRYEGHGGTNHDVVPTGRYLGLKLAKNLYFKKPQYRGGSWAVTGKGAGNVQTTFGLRGGNINIHDIVFKHLGPQPREVLGEGFNAYTVEGFTADEEFFDKLVEACVELEEKING